MAQWKKNLKFRQCIFTISKLSTLRKRLGSLFGQIWNPYIQGCIVLNFVNAFSLFLKYLPLEKVWVPSCEQIRIPSPKDVLCQFWLTLTQWFWRRFLKFRQNIFAISQFPPLEKGGGLHLKKKTWIPFTQGLSLPSLFEIGPLALEKKIL